MLRVLVVDDDPHIAALLHAILAMDGCDVISAGTLEVARVWIVTSKFDLVLLDLRLPDSTIANTLEVIPAFSQRAPVAIITGAMVDPALAAIGRDAGAIRMIEKSASRNFRDDVLALTAELRAAGDK